MTESSGMEERLAALEVDNARLRRLLDQAGMPDSLRPGMRDTLTMLRTIMRRSAENAEDVDSYVAHLQGRLDALTRVQTTTDTFGEADLHTLISDELLFHLVREGDGATITGPRVRLHSKAALLFALALHELASNAVEHGALPLPHGRVAVTWSARPAAQDAAEPVLILDWKESGGSGVAQPARRGFGTDVLEEMLAHDLGAHTALTYEPDGLRCAIRLRLTAAIGHRVANEGIAAAPWDDEIG